jgi:hypothetical protein
VDAGKLIPRSSCLLRDGFLGLERTIDHKAFVESMGPVNVVGLVEMCEGDQY